MDSLWKALAEVIGKRRISEMPVDPTAMIRRSQNDLEAGPVFCVACDLFFYFWAFILYFWKVVMMGSYGCSFVMDWGDGLSGSACSTQERYQQLCQRLPPWDDIPVLMVSWLP